jgi:hypothetical protein
MTEGATPEIKEALRSTVASTMDEYIAYVEAWRAANGLPTLAEWRAEFEHRDRGIVWEGDS